MRNILIAAAMMAAVAPAAFAGEAGVSETGAGDLWNALQPCRALADGARLACFDRALAARDDAKPAAAAPAAAMADFGAERLRPSGDAPPKPEEFLLAKVSAFGLNAFQHFTVTLDNGQVWRQLDSDTPVARLRGSETVKIVRGFLDSYTLTVEGAYGSFKVKRIK